MSTRKRRRQANPWHRGIILDHHKLRSLPNVERVDLGWKERGGRLTARLAVKIYVTEKHADIEPDKRIPASAKVLVPVGKGMYRTIRVPTDVVWHATPRFCAATDFIDPVLGGAAIGVPGQQAGTYACRVTNGTGAFAMTAGHVVQAFQGSITPGIQVLQPPGAAVIPPGRSPVIGTTVDGFFGNTMEGFVDFALIDVDAARSATSDALDGSAVDLQIIPAATVVHQQLQVTKMGATTGRTDAVFSTLVNSISIEGVNVVNVLEFKGTTGPFFATGGDSGALVTSAAPSTQGRIVGLLVAATPPTPDAPAGRGYVVPFERLPIEPD